MDSKYWRNLYICKLKVLSPSISINVRKISKKELGSQLKMRIIHNKMMRWIKDQFSQGSKATFSGFYIFLHNGSLQRYLHKFKIFKLNFQLSCIFQRCLLFNLAKQNTHWLVVTIRSNDYLKSIFSRIYSMLCLVWSYLTWIRICQIMVHYLKYISHSTKRQILWLYPTVHSSSSNLKVWHIVNEKGVSSYLQKVEGLVVKNDQTSA